MTSTLNNSATEFIQEPLKEKDLTEPVVLIRRRMPDIVGSRNEQLIYLPGNPAISLFTGAGGMDLGIEAAGFCVVVQHEMNRVACQTLIANHQGIPKTVEAMKGLDKHIPSYFPYAALIQGDIRKTTTSMLLKEAGLRVGEAHLVFGGPPCQGFSTANFNSYKGAYDQRNDLVFEYLRVVREAKPYFFIFENVPGFVSFNKHQYMKAFLEEAHSCYYELVYGLLNAAEYGVPQHRVRFICMGTRRDLFEIDGSLASMPEPECFSPDDLKLIKLIDTPLGLFQKDYNRLTRTPGIRYFPDRPVLIPPSPTNGQNRSKTFMDFYDKLDKEEPDRIVRCPQQKA